MAARFCGCGAPLEEAGRGLLCPRCGPAEVWAVRLDTGELVGAGARGEVFMLPAALREGLGLQQGVLERAAQPGFVPCRTWDDTETEGD